ncbi:hypothetical protein [Streptomyces sp. NPDC088794]|uniref:hypothetical protein n=1 Tax=Streptomyces sp. NPDC088794 TaxID=3365902 RepID=UPI0037F17DB1
MPETRWNGEPCAARRVTAVVADDGRFPLYWARHLVGTRRKVVEVAYDGGATFYLDDEDGSAWHKVTQGRGAPHWTHNSILIAPDSIQPRPDQPSPHETFQAGNAPPINDDTPGGKAAEEETPSDQSTSEVAYAAAAKTVRRAGYVRDQLAILLSRLPVPLPTPQELADGATADKVTAQRIHAARPGIPTHTAFNVLQALRAVRAVDRTPNADREDRILLADLTEEDLAQLYDDLDRHVEVVGEMNEQAIDLHKRTAAARAESADQVRYQARARAAAVRQAQRWAARARIAEAAVRHWIAFINRGMDTHVQFSVLNQDGTTEQLPCADWCYACRLEQAQAERARLLALLAGLLPGSVIAPAEDLDEPGWQILYLYIGTHQASWHIHPRDADLFTDVEHVSVGHPRAVWDGHTTDKKHERMEEHTTALHRAEPPHRNVPAAPGSVPIAQAHATAAERVLDLYSRWVQAGPPPLGTPIARWWDARLAELHEAVRP